MKHNCLNCRFYNYRKQVVDEKGKHECYARFFIEPPYNYFDSIEKENDCGLWKESNGKSEEIIRLEWIAGIEFSKEQTKKIYEYLENLELKNMSIKELLKKLEDDCK